MQQKCSDMTINDDNRSAVKKKDYANELIHHSSVRPYPSDFAQTVKKKQPFILNSGLQSYWAIRSFYLFNTEHILPMLSFVSSIVRDNPINALILIGLTNLSNCFPILIEASLEYFP